MCKIFKFFYILLVASVRVQDMEIYEKRYGHEQNGAEYIYESDDDNVPSQRLTLFSQLHPYRLVVKTDNIIFNPYAHFGQSSTWPRGYPLDKIGQPVPRNYISCPTDPPAIVQSLVNGDPDMDAIYRLTRKYSDIRIDIKFDKLSPLYIHPVGTFSPFNSQNTLFHRRAFWGLVFPISVTDRATDIYRSYWTQRLMWLIGQRIAFGPATFYQKRSGHNLLNDFDQEKQLYKYMGEFMGTLQYWKCSSNVFKECILQATRILVDGKYWSEDDYTLIKAWISDLIQLDPTLVNHPIVPTSNGCIANKSFSLIFHPNEQNTSLPHHPLNSIPPLATNEQAILEQLSHWCNYTISSSWNLINKSGKKLSDIILAVSIYENLNERLPVYESYFKLFFEKIIYCTTLHPSEQFVNKWKLTLIFFKKDDLSALSCLTAISLLNINIRGIFHLGDSMWLNVNQKLLTRNFDSVWLPENVSFGSKSSPTCSMNSFKCTKINPDLFKKLSSSKLYVDDLSFKTSSTFSKIMTSLKSLSNRFAVETELYVPTNFPVYFPKKSFEFLYVLKSITSEEMWTSVNQLAATFFDIHINTTELMKKRRSKSDDDFDYLPYLNIFNESKIHYLCNMFTSKISYFKLL
ncbi:hypothetical protein HELRODRAFT_165432 [Helobdella robusta]|uniref:Uncharacterized protein n=1 Tax=Helobdella robusta TaxID=6412 RepID=T1EWS2_HELRO|nr:hypothetical protein HELRODRAFT_165432 [Helobdella robusta]ESN91402.1 hypothetical protein HELRODRAFT_165432 [Helobdella robusta]